MRFTLLILALCSLSGCGKGQADNKSPENGQSTVAAVSSQADALQKLSLEELFEEIQENSAQQRSLDGAMQQDISETKARLGSKLHDASANAESERIERTWSPRMQANEQKMQALVQEIRRRCPNGATLNATEQRCN